MTDVLGDLHAIRETLKILSKSSERVSRNTLRWIVSHVEESREQLDALEEEEACYALE